MTTSQEALLDALAEVVRELPHDGVEAVGFGIPSRDRPRARARARRGQHPAARRRFATRCEQRLGLPVEMENDASCAAYAEFKLRRGPRHARPLLLTLGTGVGGGVVSGGRLFRALHRARPHGDRRGRRAVPGRVLRPRARRGVLLRARRRTSSRRRVLGPDATARDLVEQRHPALARDRPPPRDGDRLARQHLRLDARRDRRRLRHRGVRPARAGRAPGGAARGARARRARRSRSSAPTRRRGGPDRRRARRVRGARVSCDAARGLRDADREPRRRHAARARRAARGRRRARRGHAAHAHAARAPRDRRPAALATTSTTRRRASRSSLPRLAAGERVALVTDAGLPRVSDPGRAARRAALDAGVRGDGAAGRLGGRDGARRERARRRALRVRRLPAAQARRSSRRCGRETARLGLRRSSRSSRRSGCRASLRSLAAVDPSARSPSAAS